jgi:hypothetical protein
MPGEWYRKTCICTRILGGLRILLSKINCVCVDLKDLCCWPEVTLGGEKFMLSQKDADQMIARWLEWCTKWQSIIRSSNVALWSRRSPTLAMHRIAKKELRTWLRSLLLPQSYKSSKGKTRLPDKSIIWDGTDALLDIAIWIWEYEKKEIMWVSYVSCQRATGAMCESSVV